MVQFLKYVSLRLFFGTFAAAFTVYRVLCWVHDGLYAGLLFEDTRLIIWVYAGTVLAVSVLMSVWGGLRFRHILETELDRVSRNYHPETLVRAYRRSVRYLGSGYFFNTSREKLFRIAERRFGDILLSMRVEEDEALAIFESILLAEPDDSKYYVFLIRAYGKRPSLSERSWKLLRRRYHEKPDDRLVGIMAREYSHRGILDFESERVLERCLEVFPEFRPRVLEFALPRLLAFRRTDDNAVRFYLAALDGGWGEQAKPLLGAVDRRYRETSRADALALQVHRAMSGGGAPERLAGDGTLDLEGLVYEPEEESGSRAADRGIGMQSVFYGLAQHYFRAGRGAEGGYGRVIRVWVFLVLCAVFICLAATLGRRTVSFFRAGSEVASEMSAIASGATLVDSTGPGETACFAIQVGAFRDSLSAGSMAGKLKSSGLNSYVRSAAPGGKRIFRVLIGSFPSDSAAQAQARDLKSSRLIREWRVLQYTAGRGSR
jgi:hypothetical protein